MKLDIDPIDIFEELKFTKFTQIKYTASIINRNSSPDDAIQHDENVCEIYTYNVGIIFVKTLGIIFVPKNIKYYWHD